MSESLAPIPDACNPAMREEYLFTIQEFAEHVKMNEDHLRTLCRSGKLRHLRFGRAIRIPSGVLNDFIGGQ